MNGRPSLPHNTASHQSVSTVNVHIFTYLQLVTLSTRTSLLGWQTRTNYTPPSDTTKLVVSIKQNATKKSSNHLPRVTISHSRRVKTQTVPYHQSK